MCHICAQKVLKILDEMEKAGEFKYLNNDDKEIQRQIMEIRLRNNIKCPEKKGMIKNE